MDDGGSLALKQLPHVMHDSPSRLMRAWGWEGCRLSAGLIAWTRLWVEAHYEAGSRIQGFMRRKVASRKAQAFDDCFAELQQGLWPFEQWNPQGTSGNWSVRNGD